MTLPTFNELVSLLIEIALRIGAAALVFLVGRRLARYLRDRLHVALDRAAGVTDSMVALLTSMTYYSILLAVVVTSLAILGVPTNILIGAIAAAVIILGIAFQQSLTNFAATIIFLLFKPFTVGDDIQTMGVFGTVQEIQLFNTVLLQADMKLTTLPNAMIQEGGIVNYTRKGILRLSEVVGISYSDNLRLAKEILTELVEADPRVLSDPPAQILVLELAESSVNLGIRPYVKSADFWAVQAELREQVKLRFDEAGITIPFPQREVRMLGPGTKEG